MKKCFEISRLKWTILLVSVQVFAACSLKSVGSKVVRINWSELKSQSTVASARKGKANPTQTPLGIFKTSRGIAKGAGLAGGVVSRGGASGATGATGVAGSINRIPPPVDLNGFTCFAVSISGEGIPDDSRVCNGNSNHPGVVVGLVDASDNAEIDVSVPIGTGRDIRVIGVVSNIGCPDLEVVLNNQNNHSLDGQLGNPYLIGETAVDVFDDTDVTIVTNYDPIHPKDPFPDCGNGNHQEAPLFAAYIGSQGLSGVNPNGTKKPFIYPVTDITTNPAGNGFTNPPANGDPGLIQGFSFPGDGSVRDGANANERAAMRLIWDVTNLDVNRSRYFQLDLEISGGVASRPAGPKCPLDPSVASASAAILDGTKSNPPIPLWIRLGDQYPFGSPHDPNWAGLDFLSGQLIDQLAMHVSDGNGGYNKYLIVNVESNFNTTGAGALSNCNSVVNAWGARFRSVDGVDNAPMMFATTFTRIDNSLGLPKYAGATGGNEAHAEILPLGGIWPYTFQPAVPTAGIQEPIDAFGDWTPGINDSSWSVKVTDFNGTENAMLVETAVLTQPVQIAFNGPYLGDSSAFDLTHLADSSQPLDNNTCYGFNVLFENYEEAPQPLGVGVPVSIETLFPGQGRVFSNSTCSALSEISPDAGTLTSYSLSALPPASFFSFYYRPNPGAFEGGIVATAIGASAFMPLLSKLGPPTGLSISMASSFSVNSCQPVVVFSVDNFLNPDPVQGAKNITMSDNGFPGTFYTDETCSTPLTVDATIADGNDFVKVGYMTPSPSAPALVNITATEHDSPNSLSAGSGNVSTHAAP